jgi:hypothetical protein
MASIEPTPLHHVRIKLGPQADPSNIVEVDGKTMKTTRIEFVSVASEMPFLHVRLDLLCESVDIEGESLLLFGVPRDETIEVHRIKSVHNMRIGLPKDDPDGALWNHVDVLGALGKGFGKE